VIERRPPLDAFLRCCKHLEDGDSEQVRAAHQQLCGHGKLLSWCQGALADADAVAALEKGYGHLWEALGKAPKIASQLKVPAVQWEGTLRALCRAVAAAGLANRVRWRTTDTQATAQFHHWAGRAATLGDPAFPGATAPDWASDDEEKIVARCLAPFVGECSADDLAAARAAVLLLLRPQRFPERPNIPLLLRDGDTGRVARLTLTRLPRGTGRFLPSPWTFRVYEEQWLKAVVPAAAGLLPADADTVWDVSGLDRPIDGPSAAAAFRVALWLFHSDRPYDVGCAITAALQGEELTYVDGVLTTDGKPGPKLQAAADPGEGIRRVILEPGTFKELRGIRPPDGLTLLPARDVAQAADLVSADYDLLAAVFAAAMQAPDRTAFRPIYFGERTHTRLFVPPELVRWNGDGESDERRRDAKEDAGGRSVSDPTAALEIGENMLFAERLNREQRLSLDEVRRHMEQPGAWTVILAPPGQGKSLLAAWLAHDLARQAQEQMLAQQAALNQLTLPLVVRLSELVREFRGRTTEEEFRTALSAALERQPQGHGVEAARWAVPHAGEERCRLYLDGLDEVDRAASTETALQRLFEILVGWKCSVVVTSRPYGYAGRRLPEQAQTYRLAPFSAGQQQTFLDTWGGTERWRERMTQVLARSPAVTQAAQNPLLLGIIAAILEQHELPDDVTRTVLYQHALALMLGGPERFKSWFYGLQELAWEMFRRDEQSPRMSGMELVMTLRRSEEMPLPAGWPPPRPPDPNSPFRRTQEVADALCQELQERRVLVQLGGEGEYAFSHRSFAEYLAGGYLATRINLQGWDQATVPWEDRR
jgi:hypothetical protein